jgi:hypothetical protein
MMFYISVGAMASNRSIVDSYAAQMGWSVERATATLNAYGTGLYLPPLEEVKALSTLDDFETEWRIALYAYHILEMQRLGADLNAVCKPETRAKWIRGASVVSDKLKRKFLDVLGVDIDHVPEGRRYTHAGDGVGKKIVIDTRRNHLRTDRFCWTLCPVHENAYVVKLESRKEIEDLEEELRRLDIFTMPTGDFMSAVIPAHEAKVYYAKP